jgi:hypothetical protein
MILPKFPACLRNLTLHPNTLQAHHYAANTYHGFWRRERTAYHPELSPGGRLGRWRWPESGHNLAATVSNRPEWSGVNFPDLRWKVWPPLARVNRRGIGARRRDLR